MRLELKEGVAEFAFPRGMRVDNYRSSITCHALVPAQVSNKVGYIVCNASYYCSQENDSYQFNILAVFEPNTSPSEVITFPGTIEAPLNRLHNSIQIYTMDEKNNLIRLNGQIIVELSGNVEISTLM